MLKPALIIYWELIIGISLQLTVQWPRNWPWWRYLCHRNRQMLHIRAFLLGIYQDVLMNKIINERGEALLNNDNSILLSHEFDGTSVNEEMCQFVLQMT